MAIDVVSVRSPPLVLPTPPSGATVLPQRATREGQPDHGCLPGLPGVESSKLSTGQTRSACRPFIYVMDFEFDKIRHMTKIWHAGLAMKSLGWI